MKWYVIQVNTGAEIAVRDKLKELGISASVPIENRPIRKSGKWEKKEYLLFSGYVFVPMKFTADNYYKVRAIPNVIRFLIDNKSPTPLSYMEAEWIQILSGNDLPLQPSVFEEQEDGTLKITDGVLRRFDAKAIKVDKHARKATFEISVCNEVKAITLGIVIANRKSLEEKG